MEMNEWKIAWQDLDERLKKQEILETKQIREMLHTRSGKSLNRLVNFELLSVIVMLLVIPFFFYSIHLYQGISVKNSNVAEILPFLNFFFIAMIIICVLYLPWGFYKIHKLMKVNFEGNVAENHRIINRYDLFCKRERLGTFIGLPFLIAVAFYVYIKLHAPVWKWVFMICTLAICILFIYYHYKKLYYPSINAIRRNMEELKELDGEE